MKTIAWGRIMPQPRGSRLRTYQYRLLRGLRAPRRHVLDVKDVCFAASEPHAHHNDSGTAASTYSIIL